MNRNNKNENETLRTGNLYTESDTRRFFLDFSGLS